MPVGGGVDGRVSCFTFPQQSPATSWYGFWFWSRWARNQTLVSVSGCSVPSTFCLSSSVRRFMASASSYFPCLCSVDARLLMLVSVLGCSVPSTFCLSSSVRRFMASASSYFPWLFSTTAVSARLSKTVESSSFRTRRRVFSASWLRSRASLYFP